MSSRCGALPPLRERLFDASKSCSNPCGRWRPVKDSKQRPAVVVSDVRFGFWVTHQRVQLGDLRVTEM
jgi:hypothetical protein